MSTTFTSRIASTARAVAAAAIIGTAGISAVAGIGLGLAGTASATPYVQSGQTAGMYGDPEAAAKYWQLQHYDDCALMSVAEVVGQITGDLPSEAQMIKLGEKTPSETHPGSIYMRPADSSNPNSGQGTSPTDIVVLLEKLDVHGVQTDADHQDETGVATGLEALEKYLAQGHAVIVGVNAETIWDSEDGQRTKPDHALVVTGVDTKKGIVHLNDSGTKNGKDEQVSIATFMKAWQTSGYTMIITQETVAE
jgi:hypothetical protein